MDYKKHNSDLFEQITDGSKIDLLTHRGLASKALFALRYPERIRLFNLLVEP